MTRPLCDVCSKPVLDQARLCGRCRGLLARDLGDVPALVGELEVTRWGQATRGRLVGGTRSDEQPIPFDVAASEVAEALGSTLVAWARVVVEERGVDWPAEDLGSVAGFVLLHLTWVCHHPAAAEAWDELRHAIGRVRRVIDLAPNRTTFLVGPCPERDAVGTACPGEVRAFIATEDCGPSRLECAACGAVFEAHQWLRAGRRILDRMEAAG